MSDATGEDVTATERERHAAAKAVVGAVEKATGGRYTNPAYAFGSRCTVPWCEAEVIVWSEIQATYTTGLVVVTVPFCREHGPRVGSDV